MRRTLLGPMVLITSTLGWTLGVASVAAASCAEPPPLEQSLEEAQTVFVGTVVEIENDGRWAVFEVEEIWKGPDLDERVIVHGGPGPGVATSADRTYEPGTRYLVVPVAPAGAAMEDNGCTATQPYTADLDTLRPTDARFPAAVVTDSSSGGSFEGLAYVGLVLLAAVAARAFLVRPLRAPGRPA